MQENQRKLSEISERFLTAMDSLKLKPSNLKKDLDINMQKMTKISQGLQKSPNAKDIKRFSEKYGVNEAWIYTGKGNMLVGDNQTNESGNNTIHKGKGNIINVELPNSGQQKIIRSDGSMEITNDCERQNDARIADLERIIALKDEVISSKNNEIETLKTYIDVLKNINK